MIPSDKLIHLACDARERIGRHRVLPADKLIHRERHGPVPMDKLIHRERHAPLPTVDEMPTDVV